MEGGRKRRVKKTKFKKISSPLPNPKRRQSQRAEESDDDNNSVKEIPVNIKVAKRAPAQLTPHVEPKKKMKLTQQSQPLTPTSNISKKLDFDKLSHSQQVCAIVSSPACSHQSTGSLKPGTSLTQTKLKVDKHSNKMTYAPDDPNSQSKNSLASGTNSELANLEKTGDENDDEEDDADESTLTESNSKLRSLGTTPPDDKVRAYLQNQQAAGKYCYLTLLFYKHWCLLLKYLILLDFQIIRHFCIIL